MKKGNLTREEVVGLVGEAAVAAVDNENCDFTNRVGYNGSCQGDDEVEFSASVSTEDGVLIAYYYQDAESVDKNELDCLDWQIRGYEFV